MTATYLPTSNNTLQAIIPAYVYQQYADDDDIQAFNSAYNNTAQSYLNWFTGIELPIYTSSTINGALLDWVAQGIYGISRPTLPSGSVRGIGLLNTYEMNTIKINQFTTSGSVTVYVCSDDIFKRIITWHFFKGDGQQFSIPWLKRRIMRFLVGLNGSSPNVSNTYPISITASGGGVFVIKIKLNSTSTADGITLANTTILQAAIQDNALALPIQYTFSVNIINDL